MRLNASSIYGERRREPYFAALEGPIKVTYNPPDDEFNVWMYGVIFIGCAFVLFVIAGVYVMCNSPTGNQPMTPIRRHPTMRDRDRERESRMSARD